MPCPDTTTWRAWLDDEATPADADRHLASCTDCTREVSRLQDDASYAATAIALLDPPATVDAAAPAPAPVSSRRDRQLRTGRGRQWATSAAAALVAVVVVGTPAGRAAAADFLALFRSERVALVAVDEPSLTQAVEALDELGDADEISETDPVEVATIEEAIDRTGIAVTVPDAATLPEGTPSQPLVRVSDEQQLRFTFSESETRAYLAEHDEADRPLPDGYDGATLVVDVPAAVLQQYGTGDGLPAVLVGHAGAVTAAVDGDIELDTLRSFLLELPGLPDSVVEQLATIDDWRNTLPIPVPIDHINGEETTVDGAEAILIQEQGLGSGLLWQRDGVVTGVAGRLDEAELRAVVDSLRAP